jgi:hypothetical protein
MFGIECDAVGHSTSRSQFVEGISGRWGLLNEPGRLVGVKWPVDVHEQ